MSGAVAGRDRRGSSPFELVLSKLPDAAPVAGTGQKAWKARCPAHADTNPSLSVTVGDHGGALVHCYAGCPPEAVVAALGLTMADLMPPKERGAGRNARTPADGREPTRTLPFGSETGFETADEAVAALERRMGPCSTIWTYHDDYEDPVGLICRWDREGGKDIRPVSRRGQRWFLSGMTPPRPLYRLVELLQRRDERVYVVEGEKAADAGTRMGLLATTSPHGSQSADKADWRPLAGRDVAILPDNDEPGRRYAQDVARILCALQPPATVRIVTLPTDEVGPGGDLDDWLEHHDAVETETLAARLETLVRSVPVRAYLQEEKRTPDGVTTNEVARDTCPVARPSDEAPTAELIVQCMADIVPTEVRWLWPGRIARGRITLLVGRPGEGKSFLTTDLAARVSTGVPWPDGTTACEGSVLLICAEDDPADTIWPRLHAHGADLRRVHLVSMVRRREPDGRPWEELFTLRDVSALEQGLRAHPDCRLVVVDPIGSFLGGGTDSHRDSEVRSVLAPVAKLAETYGTAVLVVAHRRKSAAGFADDQALGSRAFTGIARAVWHLTRDREDKARRLLLPGKNNLAAEGTGLAFTIAGDPARIGWETDPVALTADEALKEETAPSDNDDAPSVRDEVAHWLQDLLAEGPVPATQVRDLAKAQGIAARTLERVKGDLCIRSVKQGHRDGGAWFWTLPEANVASQIEESRETQEVGAESLW